MFVAVKLVVGLIVILTTREPTNSVVAAILVPETCSKMDENNYLLLVARDRSVEISG